MRLHQLLEKLGSSAEFDNFKNQNPNAKPCAGFFIFDFAQNKADYALDFKAGGSIFSFSFSPDLQTVRFKEEEVVDKSKPLEEIGLPAKIFPDINEIMEFAQKILVKNGINKKLEKIIAVLQMQDNLLVWNLTCMCSGFSIVLVQINAGTGQVLKCENKNLFDFVSAKKP